MIPYTFMHACMQTYVHAFVHACLPTYQQTIRQYKLIQAYTHRDRYIHIQAGRKTDICNTYGRTDVHMYIQYMVGTIHSNIRMYVHANGHTYRDTDIQAFRHTAVEPYRRTDATTYIHAVR